MFKKKLLLPIMILVIVLSLVACTSDDPDPSMDTTPVEDEDQGTDDNSTEDESTEETPEEDIEVDDVSTDEYANIKVKPEEAFDTFMEKYPNSKVKKVQLDKDMGSFIYKVEGFEGNMEYEIKIDPIEGIITKEDTESDDDMDDMPITRANVEKVQAIVDKAMAEAGEGAKLEEWTVEEDDGRVELEIEIDRKGFDDQERVYDVETGELIEIDD